ncbi:unnamed protein product [Bursaphelenchus okinawaensis]|uniref:FABP domain-containing protein n=1 Tax=Bursaphelenchus okinawaensis TaxID=465554 RepID=A0A811LM16_9BILA|nr:unnamed protein product [Bursaphelenchus okinawaensis]CAG9126340.1 unnamed protein product [Bursaphelenchus okinawaensis]
MATIPEPFFGTFKLEKSEKFDEYLASRGVNWFIRKMIQMSSITKVVIPGTEGTYTFLNKSSKADLKYENVKLGQEFEDKGFDGALHKITFDMDGDNVLTEKHIRLDRPGEPGETYRYTIDGNYLILALTNGDITAKRFFKKTD